MRHFTTPWLTAICLSALSSYVWPALPALSLLAALLVLATLLIAILTLRHARSSTSRRLCAVAILIHGTVLGALWMASVGHWYYEWQLPRNKIQEDVVITGSVVAASCRGQQHHYTLATDFLSPGDSRLIRVYEQTAQACLRYHDTVTATVRLKPAYGVANPIGFNYQQYLASRAIVATGSLRTRHKVVRPPPTFRQQVTAQIKAFDSGYGRWLDLLVLGDPSSLSDEDWALLQRTGTGHLFSISGLHVGIVAMTLLFAMGLITALPGWGARLPSRLLYCLALIALVALVWGYVQLAGEGLPVVRAWLLLFIGTGLRLCRKHLNGLQVGLVMLTGCLLLFPLSLLAAGFHLSVGAVLAIWLLCWRWQWYRLRWFDALWRLQLALTLLLLPAIIAWFSAISLSGILINLLLIPLMSVMLPVVLLTVVSGSVVTALAPGALWLANRLIEGMINTLVWLDATLPAPVNWYVETPAVAALLLSVVVLCLPLFRYRRRCAFLLALPAGLSLLPMNSHPWYVHIVDAGQGTAVVVSRGQRAIVIDTGPASQRGAPTVEQAMVPLINQLKLTIDYVIVSHGDNDHDGGVPALRQFLSARQIAPQWLWPDKGCEAGRIIHWHGLTLTFHWPDASRSFEGNNGSCVLSISDQLHSVLLPGDIERTAEYALLSTPANLQAEVLIAPHHGSLTSSTGALLDRVAAKIVIFTQGNENRWGFPAREVVTRNRERGANMFATSETGYIRLSMNAADTVTVETFRHDLRKRWYLRPNRPVNFD